jgi:hypothetical protein
MRLHQFYRIILIHGCVLSSSLIFSSRKKDRLSS